VKRKRASNTSHPKNEKEEIRTNVGKKTGDWGSDRSLKPIGRKCSKELSGKKTDQKTVVWSKTTTW